MIRAFQHLKTNEIVKIELFSWKITNNKAHKFSFFDLFVNRENENFKNIFVFPKNFLLRERFLDV